MNVGKRQVRMSLDDLVGSHSEVLVFGRDLCNLDVGASYQIVLMLDARILPSRLIKGTPR
jgi:hypothetical protein